MTEEQPHLTTPSFEQHPTGFGIGIAAPRISWRFLSSTFTTRNWEQSAYDVEIIHIPGAIVETYHVSSSHSLLVPWPSRALTSRGQTRVRVRAYGRTQSAGVTIDLGATDWSQWAVVECGLLDREDWIARPITIVEQQRESNRPLRPLRFRKMFTIPIQTAVSKARLYIMSLGSYTAYINGVRVGEDCLAPGWTSYNHRIHYQVFDVGKLVLPGQENIIAVEVGEGWYATRLGFLGGKCCIWGRDLAVLAQLEIVSEQGDEFKVCSDDSWKCSLSAIIRSEIYDGELYDAREEDDS